MKSHAGFRFVPILMTLNDHERRNSLTLHFFTEFDSFADRLCHSGWRQTYNISKILSPSSSLLLLAKTITHPAAQSLCDNWASCYLFLLKTTTNESSVYSFSSANKWTKWIL